MKTLILGIGNLLLGDEGVGVHVARTLAGCELPEGTWAVEAGTAFLDVLPEIEQADRIFLVDAMEAGGPPGSVYRLPFDQCYHPDTLASLHGFDMSRVLYMAGNNRSPEVMVFGIEPATIEWGVELSEPVQRAVPLVERLIRAEIAN
jgi:hydrogenase maturation protease